MSSLKKILIACTIASSSLALAGNQAIAQGPAGGTTSALSATAQKLAVGSAHAWVRVTVKR